MARLSRAAIRHVAWAAVAAAASCTSWTRMARRRCCTPSKESQTEAYQSHLWSWIRREISMGLVHWAVMRRGIATFLFRRKGAELFLRSIRLALFPCFSLLTVRTGTILVR